MKPICNALEYLDSEMFYTFNESLDEGMELWVYIQIHSEKFVEYQKEIIQEFIADFIDGTKNTSLSSKEIEEQLEQQLQRLNKKLQSFADKLREVPKCDLRGYVQLIADDSVKTWMIGKTTLMIFRGEKIYSVLENSFKAQANVDQFSDFIGGELERGDVLLYVGTKISELLDQNDFAEIEQVLAKENASAMMDCIDDIVASRIDKYEVGFLKSFSMTGIETSPRRRQGKLSQLASTYTSKLAGKVISKYDLAKRKNRTYKVFKNNRYHVMIGVLLCAIVFLAVGALMQIRGKKSEIVYFTTATGAQIILTIDNIRNDIMEFRNLDSSSNEKGNKYKEILQKLTLLEEKGLWQQDVLTLKNMLNKDYEKGFMIETITSLSQFDTDNTKKTRIFSFNSAEKTKLGTPLHIGVGNSVNIAGNQGALLNVINDASRGSIVEYQAGGTAKDCVLNLTKRGFFCFTEGGELFGVNKAGIELMETEGEDWSTKTIGGLGTYGRNNLYLFQPSVKNTGSVFLTRYRNIAGSETKYQKGTHYTMIPISGTVLPEQLGGFAIDENFYARGDGKLFQFRRSSNAGTALDFREVPLKGGDIQISNYSNDVKVIAHSDSPYVYLFDREKQTFTVYNSSPVKTHDNHKTNFQLYYLFRFKFALTQGEQKIYDVTIPPAIGNRPELYLLSDAGVSKINLYDIIDAALKNKNRKAE